MRQVLINKGKAYLENVPAPHVEDGLVLVQVAYSCVSKGTEIAGISSSGKSIFNRVLEKPERIRQVAKLVADQGINKTRAIIENKVLPSNKPTGYSAAGIVIGVGRGVEGFKVGDRVACAGNQYAHHAEFITAPKNLVVRIPQGVEISEASTVALGAIAIQGIRRAMPTLGETVCVIGLGIIGQLTAQLLQANGCRVIGVDLDPAKIDIALRQGINEGLNPAVDDLLSVLSRMTGGQGADAVIVTAATASNTVISEAFQVCRKKGRVILVGDVGLNLERKDFYAKEIDFLISSSYGPGRYDSNYEEKGADYPLAYVRWTENRNMSAYLDLLAEKKICISHLITQIVPIESAPELYEGLLKERKGSLISLLSYHSDSGEKPLHTILIGKIRNSSGRVRIALVGAGNFAKSTHLPLLSELGDLYDLRAIVSHSGPNALTLAKKYAVPEVSTSFTNILAEANIDAVLIATRHHLHAGMVMEALNAGKHVFVEKPLALTEDELQQIESFFARQGSSKPLLQTGFNRRFSAMLSLLKQVVTNRTNPMVINYCMNAGYQPPESWLHGPEGGGRNRGEACHIYDLFTFLTDAHLVDMNYSSITPKTGFYRMDDNFVTTVSFDDGSVATLVYTSMGDRNYPKEKMELFCDGWVASLVDYKSLSFTGKKIEELKTKTINKGHREELKAFAKAILENADWPIPLWQQLQATRISWAGLSE